jgi:hypothetical protein
VELQLDWRDEMDTSSLPLAALAECLSNPEHARMSVDIATLATTLLSCCLSLERCVWVAADDARLHVLRPLFAQANRFVHLEATCAL